MSISVVFRIVNILIFVGIIVYMMRKKFSVLIMQKIHEKELEFEHLIKKKKEIIQCTENIKITLAQEQEFMKKLKRNIGYWQQVRHQSEQEQQERRQMIMRALEQKAQQQVYSNNNEYLQKKIIIQALDQTKNALKEKFQEPLMQDAYLNAVVKRIEHHEYRTR